MKTGISIQPFTCGQTNIVSKSLQLCCTQSPHLSCVPQVVCEAAYYAACVQRLRPEDQDVLVEFPRVERVVQRVPRVRPPQGFALSQARQQARKVHMLHTMLKVGQEEISEVRKMMLETVSVLL